MVSPPSRRKFAAIGLATLCLTGLAGCYDVTTSGDESIYSFTLWARLGVIVAGVAFVPLGWMIRKRIARLGYALLILGPVLLIFVAPSMFTDRVRVTPDEFETSYGLWFSPTAVKVRFDELSQIRIVGKRGSRGRISYDMHCMTKTGQDKVVPLGDLVKNAVNEIAERAQEHHVAVSEDEP